MKYNNALNNPAFLSQRDRRNLDRAIELAKLSDCRYRHGAVIVKHGKTVSVGINATINDPRFLDDPTAAIHAAIHAEVAALNAIRKVDLRGATIYVARVSKRGEPMMSMPCARCQKALTARGVKKIVYTIDHMVVLD